MKNVTRKSRNLTRYLALIPVPVLIVLIIIFGLLHPSAKVIEPAYLFPILNTVFLFLVSCVVAYVAMRSYLASGSSPILLLGTGVLVFGTGSFASGWTIDRWGVNVSATVHNAPLLLAAVFHIAGVIASAKEQPPETDPVRRQWKLFTAYISAPIFVFSVFLLSVKGIIPQFFIAGVGTTALRQAVLASAFVLFVYASSYMMTRFLWKKEPYLYWYSLALTLLSIMSAGFYIQPAVGSPVGWVGRGAQYLAGIYLIAAVISAKRQAQMRGVPMNEAVAELFLTPGFHWQDILRTSLNGFSIADTKGRFIEVNDACCRIMGFTRTELLSMTIADVEAIDSPSQVLHRIEALKEKKTDHFISQHRRKDGSIIDVEVNTRYLDIGTGQIASFFQDITERKQAEAKLHRYELLAKLHRDVILFIELDSGRILEANDAATRAYGYRHDQLLTLTIHDLRTADSRGLTADQIAMAYDQSLLFEMIHRRRDGSAFPVEVSTQGAEIGGKRILISVIRDITERKQIESELSKKTAALEERTRQIEAANKELESFSYSVSHDLRAPLRAIDGYSRMILRQQGDKFDGNARRQFDVIRDNTKMMGQLIDDLLALSRLGREALSIARLNVEELTRDVWEELKAINPGRAMELRIDHMPPGMGDRSFIKQVLANILSNAIKFTRDRDIPLVEAGGYEKATENVYYVRDNGVGFDMQYHDKLFGVFQRLHSAADYEGTGIGLTIVQRIIQRHGGRVWAEGEPDKGATFYFTLPL